MIFKVFFCTVNSKGSPTQPFRICKIISVENGPQLESRISSIITNLKADGYEVAEVEDCWNISEPSIIGPR